jgi:hypothetical protein
MALTLFTTLLTLSLHAVPLGSARAGATEARGSVTAVRSEQMAKRQELNQLAAQIEVLKAKAKGKLRSGSELDLALKLSQALSDELSDLARALAAKEAAAERAQTALLDSLSSELLAQRSQFDTQTDRAKRKALIDSMRSLRVEREQVRAALPASALPKVETAPASDDPEALLELADATRDDEDKVHKKLATLEGRIKEAREERALDQRMRQFMSEDSLFDEQDRRLRVQREVTVEVRGTQAAPPAAGAMTDKKTGPRLEAAESMSFGSPTPNVGALDSPARMAPDPVSPPAGDTTPNHAITPPPTFRTETVRGTDGKPTVGTTAIAGSEDDDLEELEIQRKKLKSLAEQLKARALELEKKAKQLK